MSLRNSLRAATELRVARPNERNTQLSGVATATDTATVAQQLPANPHEYRVSCATDTATVAQQVVLGERNSDEKLRVAFATPRNSQLGALTAHRLPAELTDAINKCCDERGDDAQNRAALIAECLALSPEHQADALEHFRTEAAGWQRANRGEST